MRTPRVLGFKAREKLSSGHPNCAVFNNDPGLQLLSTFQGHIVDGDWENKQTEKKSNNMRV